MLSVDVPVGRALRRRATSTLPGGDPVQQVRWIFLAFSLATAILLVGVLCAAALSGRRVAALAACLVPLLGAGWIIDYRGTVRALSMDVVEAAALFAVGVAASSPLSVLLLLAARLSFRALTESAVRLVAATVAFSAAYVGALVVWWLNNGGVDHVDYVYLTAAFPLAATASHVVGRTVATLERSTHRERLLREAIAGLSGTLQDDRLPQAVADSLHSLLADPSAGVDVALGPATDMRVVASSRRPLPSGRLGAPVNLASATPEQLSRMRHGGLQLTGAELAASWSPKNGPVPDALYLASLTAGGQSMGMISVAGRPIPTDDVSAVATLVEHIELLFESAAMSRELQTRQANERIESLTRHTSDVITVIDRNGVVRYTSPASGVVLGVAPATLVTRRLADVAHPDDRATVDTQLETAMTRDGAIEPFEFRVAPGEGTDRVVEAVGTNLLHDADVDGVVVTMRDVTERRRMEDGLRESEANFRRLFEANPQPMWLCATDGLQFLAVNDAAVHQYGYSRDEFRSMRADDIRITAAPRTIGARNRRRPDAREETRHRLRDGRIIDVEVDSSRLRFQARDAILMLARDVTAERDLQRRLEYQALHDPLTGLANRRLLDSHITRSLTRSRQRPGHDPAILVLDLDGFKNINDTLGHAMGDAVIVAVANRIAEALRPTDTAARMSGDEFAILLDEVGGPDDAVEVARRLVASIRCPLDIDGRVLAVSASVGVALSRPEHASADDLVGDADIAMYVAKGGGTGLCVLFEPRQRVALIDRLTLQEELRAALANGQLDVHYQPQVDLATGRVVCVEALARWRHPDRGMVPPEVFITAGEQMGLIPAIDRWVLATACTQLRVWTEAGVHPVRIAVNLSGFDLQQADLVDSVRTILAESGLEPGRLELELTEGVAVGQPEAAVARLAELRSMGVRISIDDFGTGYSMFSRLRDLPIDRLKIDRSFVADITADSDARAIVASTVAMGHALGLDIVAEGVEDEATLAVLREMDCDSAQGFLFSRPVPADRLLEWLRAGRAAEHSSTGLRSPAAH